MKVRYSIDKQQRLIRTTSEGCVRFDDIRSHQDRLLADPDFDISFDQLIDTTSTEEFDISSEEARILAERRIVSPKSRRAFVAIKPHIYGMGRIMEVYHSRLGYAKVLVSYSMDEALKWLEREEKKAKQGLP